MLYRKITSYIENHLQSSSDKILIVDGARQIGKSYAIRDVGTRLYENYIEINLAEDKSGDQIFQKVKNIEDFYLMLSVKSQGKIGNYDNTLVFIDEIQECPKYITWLKFLREDHRYRFIASGSLLGVSLKSTTSLPIGSVTIKDMYQLDFEEFMIANGVAQEVIATMRASYQNRESLSESLHTVIHGLFLRYLIVGGMPDAVNTYLSTQNLIDVREVQTSIHRLYAVDASKYEEESQKKLHIRRIYDMVPSQMENKKKRILAKEIEHKDKARFETYLEDFDYLISSGICINVNAISNPKYPLAETLKKKLIKLYLNDVGLLTNILYASNIWPILNGDNSVNLGSVYESVVAQELKAHGHNLFYYDNKQKGEVDFLIDDYTTTSVLPIEVKSGKDYKVHSALSALLSVNDYGIKKAYVLSDARDVIQTDGITYLPIYFAGFISPKEMSNPIIF